MQIEQSAIEGAYLITPEQHGDSRGLFFEWFKAPLFAEAVGYDLLMAQANCSVSSKGTLRGIHFADVPPGQAKYVACLSGSIIDVVVDVRVGSPTFGQWEAVELNTENRRLVYLSEGLGHGFVALEDDSTVIYLCSTTYNPAGEREVQPFDPAIGIEWGITQGQASMSAKDSAAPSLAEAAERGLLPDYEVCKQYRAGLA